MQETPGDLVELQQLLDQSIARAGDFLRSSLQMPTCSLSAPQLACYFTGIRNVAFATTTARGEPRVAPIGTLFLRGQFYIPTIAQAARTRHVRQRPGVSLTHFVGDDLAIIVHGQASVLAADHPTFATLIQLQQQISGQSVNDWGEGIYIQVHADVIYTFARNRADYPE